jgi:CheY-like chemotaxis protein
VVVPGYRLYRSGVDADQLGSFELIAGREDAEVAWYAAFWRRRWYQSFTGQPSRLPALDRLASDHGEGAACIRTMMPLLDSLCRRADHIVRIAGHRPIPVRVIQSLQREQAEERQKAAQAGMATWATKPLTTAALRLLHQDNVQGLERMAKHHAAAYQRWRRETESVGSHLVSARAAAPSSIAPVSYAGIE